MATIQGVYLALFGRPADPLGLQFFNSVTNNGQNLAGIGPLQSSAEYQARFTGQTNTQIINSIYQSLFNRDADLPGLTFFSNALANGTLSINNIAIAIYDGAQGADRTIRDLKEAAANAFTAAIDTTAEVLGYNGTAAAASGRAFITGVTTTAPTAAQVTAAVAAATSTEGSGVSGNILTLTAAGTGDIFTTTATGASLTTSNDDTFRAITADSLESIDVIKAGGGLDIFNISDAAIKAGAAPVIDSVERFFVTSTANVTLDFTSITGEQQVWAIANTNNITFTSKAGDLTTTYGVQGNTKAVTYDIDIAGSTAGTNDIIKVALNNNDGKSATFISTNDAGTIEGLNVLAAGDTTADLANFDAFTAVKTVTVTGAGAATLTTSATTITTYDATAATGAVSFTATGAVSGAVTATGGTGADTINFANATAAVTLNGGTGNDILTGGTVADVFNGGAGGDTYTGNGGADRFNIVTTSIEDLGFDTVTDFATTVDKLAFGGPAGSATNYFEVIGSGAGFVSSRSAAQTQLSGNAALKYVAIQDTAGDTYVFFDGNGDAQLNSNTADFAVKLTGVTIANLAFGDISA
jgi:hypothetical protein